MKFANEEIAIAELWLVIKLFQSKSKCTDEETLSILKECSEMYERKIFSKKLESQKDDRI